MGVAKWENFTKEEILQFCKESNSYAQLAKKLGYSSYGGRTTATLKNCLNYYGIEIDFEKKRKEQLKESLIGQQFGRVTILNIDEEQSKKFKETYVEVQCSCENHTIFTTSLNRLKTGTCKSCGCYNNEVRSALGISHRMDFTGQKINMLLVLEYDEEKSKEHNHPYWKCKCDCGKIISISAIQLRRPQYSCGCVNQSKGERLTRMILKNLKINFIEQYRSSDLRGKSKPLSFDFFLPEKDIVIECQGQQHYKSVDMFGGEERLKLQQEYDELKRDYCKKNNIKLIEIPYWDYDKINEDYLLNLLK